MTNPAVEVNEPKHVHRTAAEQKRTVNIWGGIALAAIALVIVGNLLASAGTTETWVCLGSFVDCLAIKITPLGGFGMFLQYAMPIPALIAAGIWWAFRGIWKEEVAHEATQARKSEAAIGEAAKSED